MVCDPPTPITNQGQVILRKISINRFLAQQQKCLFVRYWQTGRVGLTSVKNKPLNDLIKNKKHAYNKILASNLNIANFGAIAYVKRDLA